MSSLSYERFAIYYLPSGDLADAGAHWLGWNAINGIISTPHIDLRYVKRAQKYGFHATIVAPFSLCEKYSYYNLREAFSTFCQSEKASRPFYLEVQTRGNFFALRPSHHNEETRRVADNALKHFHKFQDPISDTEYARKNKPYLTDRQRQHLIDWGYPFVFQDFNFHLTLTGPIHNEKIATEIHKNIKTHFNPCLACPISISHLSLMGQDRNGFFHQLENECLK